jgi:hypothetical protein
MEQPNQELYTGKYKNLLVSRRSAKDDLHSKSYGAKSLKDFTLKQTGDGAKCQIIRLKKLLVSISIMWRATAVGIVPF